MLRCVNQCHATFSLECERRKMFSQKSFYVCKRRDESSSGVLKSRIERCVCVAPEALL